MKFTEKGFIFDAVQGYGCWIVNVTGNAEFKFRVPQAHEPRYGVDVSDMKQLEDTSDGVLNALPDIGAVRNYLGDDFIDEE